MRKQKENHFNEKFSLLCSQTSSQDINWSSSESSEYENVCEYDKLTLLTHKISNNKRKRKKKLNRNICNLDITYIDPQNKDRSVLKTKNELMPLEIEDEEEIPTSPILMPTQSHKSNKYNYATGNSPIIYQKSLNQSTNIIKSPILMLKSASPKYSPKVRKKLFQTNEIDNNISGNVNCVKEREHTASNSGNINKINIHINKKIQNTDFRLYNEDRCAKNLNNKEENCDLDRRNVSNNNVQMATAIKTEIVSDIDIFKKKDTEIHSFVSCSLNDSTELLKPMNLDLNMVNKVKSYFDGHFSSENASQHSISDVLTPRNSSKSSEDVDIISIITQVNSNKNSSELVKEEINECVNLKSKSKKVRYKKDGLAYRLNGLIKKHNASISLWHHEKYLANNSNFVIPKEEHVLFQIWNVQLQYGCLLLEVRDINNMSFLVLISSNYVNDNNISKDVILKLYKPYKVIDFNNEYKLVINVCKFECVNINM